MSSRRFSRDIALFRRKIHGLSSCRKQAVRIMRILQFFQFMRCFNTAMHSWVWSAGVRANCSSAPDWLALLHTDSPVEKSLDVFRANRAHFHELQRQLFDGSEDRRIFAVLLPDRVVK